MSSKDQRRRSFSKLLGGIFLILLSCGLQLSGLCWPLEHRLLNLLPEKIGQTAFPSPSVILLTLDSGSDGFAPMDVALALRGLTLLHPNRVILDGTIASDQEATPLLSGVLDRLKKDSGISLILPHPAGTKAVFQSVPLTRYPPSLIPFPWKNLEGKASAASSEKAFLSPQGESNQELPLFAVTDEGAVIGSLWWWSLPSEMTASPPYILFNKILLCPTHTLFWITPKGNYHPLAGASVKTLALDDFLLHIEQKEQGNISPGFDALWKNATVIIGTAQENEKASALSDLLKTTSIHRFSLKNQILMILGWIALFLLVQELRYREIPYFTRWILPPLIFLGLTGGTIFLLSQGILLPWLPGIITALLMLI